MSATGRANGRSSGFSLESLHLYRKVPRDLTDATRLGGLISIACAFMMTYLFISNISEYMQMKTTTDVALDDTGEVSMRIFFNITMVRRRARPLRKRCCAAPGPSGDRARRAMLLLQPCN